MERILTSALVTVIILFVGLLLVAAFDYGNRQMKVDSEGMVIHKTFAPPAGSADSIYMLVLSGNNEVWKTRVSRNYFYSIEENDRVMLTRFVGYFSGKVYETKLITDSLNLYQMHKAEVLENDQ